MKIGIRKPSIKKSLKARTTGKAKRLIKKSLIPGYGTKGIGWIKNPKKALYNKVYNKTTMSVFPQTTQSPKNQEKEYVKMPQTRKRNNVALWILGWIFIFPVPLTILIARGQKLNKYAKIGLIVAIWLPSFLFVTISGIQGVIDSDVLGNQASSDSLRQYETSSSIENDSKDKKEQTKESTIDNLVIDFNKESEIPLEFVEKFTVSSKDSGHYRTEFRLNAYKDAVGKSYLFGNQVVDIVSTQGIVGKVDVRIYTDGASLDQCKQLIVYASKYLDPEMSDDAINDAVAYISERKEANGYYYGELGLLLLGNDVKGYNLMIKTD